MSTVHEVFTRYPTHEQRLEECKRLRPDFVIATKMMQGERQRVARYTSKGEAYGLRARFDENEPTTIATADKRLVNACLWAMMLRDERGTPATP